MRCVHKQMVRLSHDSEVSEGLLMCPPHSRMRITERDDFIEIFTEAMDDTDPATSIEQGRPYEEDSCIKDSTSQIGRGGCRIPNVTLSIHTISATRLRTNIDL